MNTTRDVAFGPAAPVGLVADAAAICSENVHHPTAKGGQQAARLRRRRVLDDACGLGERIDGDDVLVLLHCHGLALRRRVQQGELETGDGTGGAHTGRADGAEQRSRRWAGTDSAGRQHTPRGSTLLLGTLTCAYPPLLHPPSGWGPAAAPPVQSKHLRPRAARRAWGPWRRSLAGSKGGAAGRPTQPLGAALTRFWLVYRIARTCSRAKSVAGAPLSDLANGMWQATRLGAACGQQNAIWRVSDLDGMPPRCMREYSSQMPGQSAACRPANGERRAASKGSSARRMQSVSQPPTLWGITPENRCLPHSPPIAPNRPQASSCA